MQRTRAETNWGFRRAGRETSRARAQCGVLGGVGGVSLCGLLRFSVRGSSLLSCGGSLRLPALPPRGLPLYCRAGLSAADKSRTALPPRGLPLYSRAGLSAADKGRTELHCSEPVIRRETRWLMVHAVQVVLGRAAQFWEAEGPIGPGANDYSGVAHTRAPRAGLRAGWVGQASAPPASCPPPARPLVGWKVYR